MTNASGGVNHKQQYAAQQKLQRDWNRAQQHLEAVLQAYQRRQVAELAMLGAQQDKPADTAVSSSYPMLQEEKEDFFDRAMRERQAEVERISQSMNKINDIYTDLAGMVDQQQEDIDQLEDINEHTKSQTKAGLEAIQYTMWNMCAARPDEGGNGKSARSNRASQSPVMWNLCAAQQGVSKSFDNNHTHKFTEEYAENDYTHAVPKPSQSQSRQSSDPTATASRLQPATKSSSTNTRNESWANMQMPPDFDTLQANVQESAQGAYVIGSALVEELVSQVQQQVGGDKDAADRGINDAEYESIPRNLDAHKEMLQELMKKWN
ncbi:MAG: hypothetical protein SGARI_007124, partial [Bacillariaceae sp.]